MEIIINVRNFPEKMKYHRISPETPIRVIIDKSGKECRNEIIPYSGITHEEQKRILNLIPKEYEQDASEELIKIISEGVLNLQFSTVRL